MLKNLYKPRAYIRDFTVCVYDFVKNLDGRNFSSVVVVTSQKFVSFAQQSVAQYIWLMKPDFSYCLFPVTSKKKLGPLVDRHKMKN